MRWVTLRVVCRCLAMYLFKSCKNSCFVIFSICMRTAALSTSSVSLNTYDSFLFCLIFSFLLWVEIERPCYWLFEFSTFFEFEIGKLCLFLPFIGWTMSNSLSLLLLLLIWLLSSKNASFLSFYISLLLKLLSFSMPYIYKSLLLSISDSGVGSTSLELALSFFYIDFGKEYCPDYAAVMFELSFEMFYIYIFRLWIILYLICVNCIL